LNRDFLPPSAAWTAESGFFSAAQLRRSLIVDRVDADAGPVDFHENPYVSPRRRENLAHQASIRPLANSAGNLHLMPRNS
jgi:hypothetical protein